MVLVVVALLLLLLLLLLLQLLPLPLLLLLLLGPRFFLVGLWRLCAGVGPGERVVKATAVQENYYCDIWKFKITEQIT